MSVGRSQLPDARQAGEQAAQTAVSGKDPKLALVFASDSYDSAELLAGIREACPDVELIGCSTAGEISDGGPQNCGVVVAVIGGSGISVATASASASAAGLRAAGSAVAQCAAKVRSHPHRILLLLTDGLAGDQLEVVRGAYSVLGASVPLVGGCAGDDLKMRTTVQMLGDTVLTSAVVAAAIGSDAPIGIGVRHGWRRVGDPMMVTSSAGNRVLALDGRPALDAYLDKLDAPGEAHTDPEAFARFAMTHPLGLSRSCGEEIRYVWGADFEERSLGCIASVPQGGFVWLMHGDTESVLDATDDACAEALSGLRGQRPIGILAFDCIARRGVLGDDGIRAEVDRIRHNAGGVPVAGFYTYGEFARTEGLSGFHNQTLVVLALA